MLQISFSFVVFPSILIAYIGQAAYLRKFPEKVSNTFYASIPGTSLKFKRSIDTFFYNIIHGLIGISNFFFLPFIWKIFSYKKWLKQSLLLFQCVLFDIDVKYRRFPYSSLFAVDVQHFIVFHCFCFCDSASLWALKT